MKPRARQKQLGYVDGPKDGSFYLRYWGEVAGKRQRLSVEVGKKGQFESKEEANLSPEAAELRRKINAGVVGRTMGDLIAHYERDAMPVRGNSRIMYQSALHHCRDKWEAYAISELVQPANSKVIEGWLDTLKKRMVRKGIRPNTPVSYSTKKNTRVILGILFDFAMRHSYIPSMENPIRFVRLRKPERTVRRQTLTTTQLADFFADPEIPEYVKVMAHCARLMGLRISEIRGLKKDDFDLDKMELAVARRLFRHEVGAPKSEKSGEPIPLPKELFDILSAWFKSAHFVPSEADWLFTSPYTGIPYSSEGTQTKILQPWGKKHGVVRMGWHTFRHTFKQLLEDEDVRPHVVQRLMRHSSYTITGKYGSGISMDLLRGGQEAAAESMRPKPLAVQKKRQWA